MIAELRGPCDGSKPNVDDGGAHACIVLAGLVAEAAPDDALKLAEKGCANDPNECDAMMGPYAKLAKPAPPQATALAQWAWERRTPTDARGSNVYLLELQTGASKDPAKASNAAREMCSSPARGTSMACFYAAGMFPAEKAAFEERGKTKMKADIDATTAELTERIKADTTRRTARQRERQAKRDAALQAKTKATVATSAAGDPDDDSATEATPAGTKGPRTKTVNGFGHGPNRDLTCTQAKLSAVSRAGCSGLPSSQRGDCSCSQAFKQWTCNVSLTVTCR